MSSYLPVRSEFDSFNVHILQEKPVVLLDGITVLSVEIDTGYAWQVSELVLFN